MQFHLRYLIQTALNALVAVGVCVSLRLHPPLLVRFVMPLASASQSHNFPPDLF
jgi:hypothetical protein